MAIYVWDRFTMSLVLMYSRPTCGQRDGAGVRRALHSRQQGPRGLAAAGTWPTSGDGGSGRRQQRGSSGACPASPACSPAAALCPHAVPGKRPAPEASVSRAARAGPRRGPAAGCARPAPLPAAGAPPWCPGGTAVRRRHRRPPPTGRGSGDRAGAGSEVALTAQAPRAGPARPAAATPSPSSPETQARPGPPAGR